MTTVANDGKTLRLLPLHFSGYRASEVQYQSNIFLFFFTDTDLILFTEQDFAWASSFESKAPEEVGCCIFDFVPAGVFEKNKFLPELPLLPPTENGWILGY